MNRIRSLTTFSGEIFNFLENSKETWTAMIFNGTPITIGEIKQKTEDYAARLSRMGIKMGDSVGYSFPNKPEAVYLLFALARIGASGVPVFHMTPPAVRMSIFANCRVKAVLTDSSQFPALKAQSEQLPEEVTLISLEDSPGWIDEISTPTTDLPDVSSIPPSLPAMMGSSSGTTGIPKAVIFSQENAGASLRASAELARPADIGQNGTYSCVLAFPFCSSGILVLIGMMTAGMTLVFSDDLSPATFLQTVQQEKAHAIAAPPAYLEGMLRLPLISGMDLSSVKRVLSGMDFFSNSLIKRLKSYFPNLSSAANGYGLVETTNVFMTWKASSPEEFSKPTNHLQVTDNSENQVEVFNTDDNPCAIGEKGELRMKGLSNIDGYPGNPHATREAYQDGWFKTGDFAEKLDNGIIALLGRSKDIIKRGGRSVSPLLIKKVIEELEGISEAAVVGVPHELYGEMIWGFLISSGEIKEGDVMRQCRENLPAHMIPDAIRFVDQIPKNPGVGKVNMEELKETAKSELEKTGAAYA